jgi:hypothetical protein
MSRGRIKGRLPDSRDDADARHDAFSVTDARHDAFSVTDAGVNAGVERQALVRGAPPKVGMRDRRR